jgi:transposase
MLEDSVPGVRNAASELIKALGMLQTVYLGILGFAKFIPENMEVYNKALFIAPLIPWVAATYYCLRVLKTEIVRINLRSPSDIRERASELLEEKQRHLEIGFALMIAGIVMAFVMVVFRVRV